MTDGYMDIGPHEHVYRCQDCGRMADPTPEQARLDNAEAKVERLREALEAAWRADFGPLRKVLGK